MKLLLDENLPLRLKYRFSEGFTVSTVRDEGWTAIKDGQLLALMAENGFSVLITADRNLKYQQHLESHGITAIVLVAQNNRYETLKEYVPLIEGCFPLKVQGSAIEIKA